MAICAEEDYDDETNNLSNKKKNDEIELNTTAENLHNHSSMPLIDQLNDQSGYNLHIIILILKISGMFFLEGMHLTTFSILFTPFQKYYKLEETNVGILSSLIFIAVGLGSLSLTFLLQVFKRGNLIKLSMVIVQVATVVLALKINYIVFTIARLVIGFFIGALVPLVICIVTECIPVYYRAFCLTNIWITYTLGALYLLLAVELVMPTLDPNKISDVMIHFNTPTLIFTLIYLFSVEDSPRNLILTGYQEEGFVILEKQIGRSLSVQERERLISEITSCNGNRKSISIFSMFSILFNEKNRVTSSLLMFLVIIIFFNYFCPVMIMEFTLQKLGIENLNSNPKTHNNSVITQEIIVNMISIFGFVLSGILSEASSVGRKWSIALGYFAFAILNLVSFFNLSYFNLFLGFETVASYISFLVLFTYISEFYNTNVRASASGFYYFIGRISAFFSQFIGIELTKINVLFPYYLNATIAALAAILSIMLPYDTYGHYLDVDKEKEVLENKEFSRLNASKL